MPTRVASMLFLLVAILVSFQIIIGGVALWDLEVNGHWRYPEININPISF